MAKNSEIKIPEINFIKTGELIKHIEAVINVTKKSLKNSEKNFYKNSVDPFSALFDTLIQDIPVSKWIKQEKSRQNQKTLQNALGNFHQNVLGSIKGWKNLQTGKIVDIKNDKKKIIAEIKNKHNTTKGNHKVAIYDDLNHELNNEYKGYTAYYVEIIPKNKKSYNIPFTPSDNITHSKRPLNESIRVIDGKSFYHLATGDEKALEKIYTALPYIICNILGKPKLKLVKDKSFKDLFNKIY